MFPVAPKVSWEYKFILRYAHVLRDCAPDIVTRKGNERYLIQGFVVPRAADLVLFSCYSKEVALAYLLKSKYEIGLQHCDDDAQGSRRRVCMRRH